MTFGQPTKGAAQERNPLNPGPVGCDQRASVQVQVRRIRRSQQPLIETLRTGWRGEDALDGSTRAEQKTPCPTRVSTEQVATPANRKGRKTRPGRSRICMGLHRATVSRSREEAPINPIFDTSAERETELWRGDSVNPRQAVYENDEYQVRAYSLPAGCPIRRPHSRVAQYPLWSRARTRP
jgi:hypothetical protein